MSRMYLVSPIVSKMPLCGWRGMRDMGEGKIKHVTIEPGALHRPNRTVFCPTLQIDARIVAETGRRRQEFTVADGPFVWYKSDDGTAQEEDVFPLIGYFAESAESYQPTILGLEGEEALAGTYLLSLIKFVVEEGGYTGQELAVLEELYRTISLRCINLFKTQ